MKEYGPETVVSLLRRVRKGDREALNALIDRSLPRFRRWVRGRLPQSPGGPPARDLLESAMSRVLPCLQTLDVEHAGALQANLRHAIANDIARRRRRGNSRVTSTDAGPSRLEQAVTREGVERYETALQHLAPIHQQVFIARFELQQSYDEVAMAFGMPSADDARLAVTTALSQLVAAMHQSR